MDNGSRSALLVCQVFGDAFVVKEPKHFLRCTNSRCHHLSLYNLYICNVSLGIKLLGRACRVFTVLRESLRASFLLGASQSLGLRILVRIRDQDATCKH